MSITATEFKARYTEFSTLEDARINVFIADAALELDAGRWGDLYDRGLAALAAHMLALNERAALGGVTGGAAEGPVTSRSIGDVSVSLGFVSAGNQTEQYYLSTAYGQDYWRLVQIVGYGALVVC